jgi:hypothetical protein
MAGQVEDHFHDRCTNDDIIARINEPDQKARVIADEGAV